MRSRIFTILLTHNLHARERGVDPLPSCSRCGHVRTSPPQFLCHLSKRSSNARCSCYCVMCRTIPPFFFLFFLSLFLSLVHADNFFSLKEEGGDKEGLVTFDQRARVRIFHRCSLFCSLPSPLFFPNIGSFLSRDRSWSFPR